MKRLLVAITVSALVATSCGSDSDSDAEPAADDTVAADTVAAEPEPAAEDEGTPEPAITEPAVAEGTPADLAITEVVFGEHLTITNLGAGAVSIDGLWLCNRPNYVPLPTAVIAPGASIQVTDLVVPTGGGEVALYTSDSFGDSAAIVDYVAWGVGGGRLAVAVDAGIWPDGDAVAADGDAITAPSGGSSSADWTTGPGV